MVTIMYGGLSGTRIIDIICACAMFVLLFERLHIAFVILSFQNHMVEFEVLICGFIG